MLPGQPSRTMLRSAIRRAAHQLLDDPLILNDPIVVGLVPEASEPSIRDTLDELGAPDPKLFRYMFAMRSRFTEDRLAKAALRGVSQYLIIGAGLDTFPWRQPDFAKSMQIFAADHPASLAWTQMRLRQHGLFRPANLTYVPVDLDERRLDQQLAACGFEREAMCFCSALGLLQYLERDTIDAMLGFAASLANGSEFVFSFAPSEDYSDAEREAFNSFGARPAALGEPWKSRFHPADIISQLRSLGFGDVLHVTPELARQLYFPDQPIEEPPRWDHLIAATISQAELID
jgi:methyltransferase (TIGR00027 family)